MRRRVFSRGVAELDTRRSTASDLRDAGGGMFGCRHHADGRRGEVGSAVSTDDDY
ncbi:MAG: hypothetical protein HQ518_31540 [Rhodopirellula sp.]|nr:hypothetical protein [Rhodopirellula sp.]